MAMVTMSTERPQPAAAAAAPVTTEHPLLSRPILPTLARLSVPNVAAMMATALVAIAETAYVGLLGIPQLAGIALVFPMVMLQQMMSAGAMGGGVSSAISRALGAGDVARAETLVRHAMIIGLTMGAIFTAVFLTLGPGIFRLLGGRGAALEQALAYANVAFLGSIAICLTNTLASVLRGTGNMRVPSAVLLVLAALQIVLGGALGLGVGPLPRLGMSGIALGQVIAFLGGASFLVWHLASGRARVRLRLSGGLQWSMFRDILKVGAVACVSPVQSVATVLLVTAMVSRFGTEMLAGYGIGARLEFLLVPITFAIGVASVPMVGMAIGAGNVARARRVAWTAGGLAAGLIGAIGVVVALAPDLWSRLFTDNLGVLSAARTYLTIAGPAYTFLGLGLALYFASLGSGKIVGPVLAQSLRLLVIAIGGWWLNAVGGSATAFFALVGVSLFAYGAAAFLAVWLVRWGPASNSQKGN
ncbi:MAG: MATE family efflux transporter [Hyphomicrobiaceae bacterium]